jgi:hypothetical protein
VRPILSIRQSTNFKFQIPKVGETKSLIQSMRLEFGIFYLEFYLLYFFAGVVAAGLFN